MLKKYILLALIFGAILIGNSYTILDYYGAEHGVDCNDYMKMAQGDYNVSITRRYRVIVPFLAGSVYQLFNKEIYNEKILLCSFFLINTLIMLIASLFIYKLCIRHNITVLASVIGVISCISGRWAGYSTAHPLTDSLYLCMIVVFFYYIMIKEIYWQFLLLFLGVLSKESFVFFLPLYLYFNPSKWYLKLFVLFLTMVSFYAVRNTLDIQMGIDNMKSVSNAINHFENFVYSFNLIFSLFGIAILLSVHNFFNLIILFGIKNKAELIRKSWNQIETPLKFIPIIILVHMLLSGTVDRMYFFSAPLFAVFIALLLDKLKLEQILK